MDALGSFKSRLLITIAVLVFFVGVAIFALGFAALTVCGCGPVPDVPPPASQVSKR